MKYDVDRSKSDSKEEIHLPSKIKWMGKFVMIFSDLIYQYWKKSKSSNFQCSRFITLHEICGSDLVVVCISVRANRIHKGYLFILKMHTLNATQRWFLPLLQPTHILHAHSNHHPSLSTHIHSSQWTKSAKHRSLTIEDEIDDNDMDPNLEEPLRAKLRQEPSRQGAQKEHLIFQP